MRDHNLARDLQYLHWRRFFDIIYNPLIIDLGIPYLCSETFDLDFEAPYCSFVALTYEGFVGNKKDVDRRPSFWGGHSLYVEKCCSLFQR